MTFFDLQVPPSLISMVMFFWGFVMVSVVRICGQSLQCPHFSVVLCDCGSNDIDMNNIYEEKSIVAFRWRNKHQKPPLQKWSQRKRRSLIKRKKRLQNTLNRLCNSTSSAGDILQQQRKIHLIDQDIKATIRSEMQVEEEQAINNLKHDPKVFLPTPKRNLNLITALTSWWTMTTC